MKFSERRGILQAISQKYFRKHQEYQEATTESKPRKHIRSIVLKRHFLTYTLVTGHIPKNLI